MSVLSGVEVAGETRTRRHATWPVSSQLNWEKVFKGPARFQSLAGER